MNPSADVTLQYHKWTSSPRVMLLATYKKLGLAKDLYPSKPEDLDNDALISAIMSKKYGPVWSSKLVKEQLQVSLSKVIIDQVIEGKSASKVVSEAGSDDSPEAYMAALNHLEQLSKSLNQIRSMQVIRKDPKAKTIISTISKSIDDLYNLLEGN